MISNTFEISVAKGCLSINRPWRYVLLSNLAFTKPILGEPTLFVGLIPLCLRETVVLKAPVKVLMQKENKFVEWAFVSYI